VERFTKLTVTLWACAAIACQVWFLKASWFELPWLTIATTLVMAGLGAFDRRAIALVLASGYTFPVIVYWLRERQYGPYVVLWMAALLGVMLPDIVRTRWHIPLRWRLPLVFSALAVVISSGVVTWREYDGAWGLFWAFDAMHFLGEGPPPFIVSWTLHVALILGIGILWFDWLCGAPDLPFEDVVITPLVLAALVSASVSVYQMFWRISFFNQTAFATIGRATGTLWDANVAGMLSALWIGGTALWAIRRRGWRLAIAPVAVVLHWLAVWGSGSRTALVCAGLVTVGVLATLLFDNGRVQMRRVLLAAGAVAAVLALGIAIGMANPKAGNPAARLWDTFTSFPSPLALGREMWNRNGYGFAASEFVRRFPVAGIGVGAFHSMVTASTPQIWLPPDNAQNWLRHQVAEFGFLGAAGWLVWFVSFAWFVIAPRAGRQQGAWILQVMLLAFGFISQLGMPGQDLMVAVTFWTIAFWYVRLAGVPSPARPRIPAWAWSTAVVGLATFAVSGTLSARTDLRLPQRALRDNIPFSYGVGPVLGDGADAGFRSLQPRAAALVDRSLRWLTVTVRLGEGVPPADVLITADGHTLIKAQLTGTTPVAAALDVSDGSPRIRLESVVERDGLPWQPDAAGTGVLIKWESVFDRPPQLQQYPR
jgi:hypothetical protein